jgi:RNA polymerase sigma-70 factor (ECF subfamily)
MQRDDEAALLEKAIACDPTALGELYDRHAARIYHYIFAHIGDAQLAEDMTSTVFIKMLDAVQSSKGWQQSFLAWLYRIAHNLIVDHFRRNEPSKMLPLDEHLVAAVDDPVTAVEKAMAASALGGAVAQLTGEQQTVVVLKFFEGMTNLQVAKAMGKTEGAIKSLQFRALGTLRRILEGDSRQRDV